MKIAICDDEKEFRDLIRVYIEDYLNTKDILYAIDTFISGEKFLSETSRYHIVKDIGIIQSILPIKR